MLYGQINFLKIKILLCNVLYLWLNFKFIRYSLDKRIDLGFFKKQLLYLGFFKKQFTNDMYDRWILLHKIYVNNRITR